jgi:hypothetical protein
MEECRDGDDGREDYGEREDHKREKSDEGKVNKETGAVHGKLILFYFF